MTSLDPSGPLDLPVIAKDRARLRWFGLAEYGAILQLQEELRASRGRDEIPDTWLIGEHLNVITQGVRAKEDEVLSGASCSSLAPVFKIDRGGMTTLHNPGQLIIYPIVQVRGGSLAAGRMAHALIQTMALWVEREFGVGAVSRPHAPGLYVEGRKLMSIGISVRAGISMHGVALNLCNDLSLWSAIIPCGDPSTRPTSLSEILGRRVEPAAQIESIEGWLRDPWGYAGVERSEFAAGITPGTAI